MPAEAPAALKAAGDYVQQASEWHDVKCRVDTLQAHRNAPAAASVTTQQALCKQLQTANANFRTIVADQQEIANRVRALKARECIPVERAHQSDVAALLRAVFAAAPQLQQLYEDVAWALSTPASEPGAAWEDRLQPLLAAAGACGAYESGLAAQEALLAKLMEVAAAGPGGAGSGGAAAAGMAGGAAGGVTSATAAAF
ncbi:hypothetical protein HXX76_015825 [Chlamydomonas incerta]|uniref:Uncharacterized protein n=1 Tax=Chlamydomonas incerta TaxID=51695 RepID=A0A835S9D8_CHLIN|nr:hypothetical protein HXX76_015825 [Chlamydomonas incerta]|eukprot:KAG2422739.1 hypothetical protein HXX76_015825 [Chlamydomonas incerta]